MRSLPHLIPLLLAAALLWVQPPARARAVQASAAGFPAPITLESGQGGLLQGAAAEGPLAYLLEGGQLVILDISDPDAPRLRSRTPMPGRAGTLTVASQTVYALCEGASAGLCGGPETLWIYDVRDPDAPALAARLRTDWFWPLGYLRAADGMLWLADAGELRVFDLRDPHAPAPVVRLAGSFFDQVKAGPWLYLAERTRGLQVWDVSDLRTPALRRTLAPVSGQVLDYTGVALSGPRLYLSAFPRNGTDPASALMTFDLSSPDSPALLANVSAPARFVSAAGARLVTLVRGRLLVYDMGNPAQPRALADRPLGAGALLAHDGRLYALNESAWHILDLDSAGGLTPRGAYRIVWPLSHVWRVRLAGQRLYTQGIHGIQIVDVSDPRRPAFQGSLLIEQIAEAPLSIDGDRLVLLDGGTLRLIDASDPYSPTVRASLELPSIEFGGSFASMSVVGGRAYVLSSGPYTKARLDILDISGTAGPRLLSSFKPSLDLGSVTMHVAGDRVYLASSNSNCGAGCPAGRCTVVALDVSDPARPREGAGRFTDQSCAITLLAAYGPTLFVSGQTTRTFDVSDIDLFKPLEFVYPWRLHSFAAIGERAYLTDGAALAILDLSDPRRPRTLARYWPGGGSVAAPRISGGRAYLFSDGLRVLDLRDPAGPLPLAVYEASLYSLWNSGVTDFTVGGDYVYLALAWSGFQVLQLHPERFPAPLRLPLARKGAA